MELAISKNFSDNPHCCDPDICFSGRGAAQVDRQLSFMAQKTMLRVGTSASYRWRCFERQRKTRKSEREREREGGREGESGGCIVHCAEDVG